MSEDQLEKPGERIQSDQHTGAPQLSWFGCFSEAPVRVQGPSAHFDFQFEETP